MRKSQFPESRIINIQKRSEVHIQKIIITCGIVFLGAFFFSSLFSLS